MGYALRGEKKYEVPDSPLLVVRWWRLVMDEVPPRRCVCSRMGRR